MPRGRSCAVARSTIGCVCSRLPPGRGRRAAGRSGHRGRQGRARATAARARVRLETTDGRVPGGRPPTTRGVQLHPVAPGTYAVVAEQRRVRAGHRHRDPDRCRKGRARTWRWPRSGRWTSQVAAKRLEEERIKIQPRVGASTYEFEQGDRESAGRREQLRCPASCSRRPGSRRTPPAPAGSHVREQMGNVQYRINGIVLPEGVTLFAQGGGLSPRLASSITLLTGALPAEYRSADHGHLRHPDQERRLRAGRPRGRLRGQPRVAAAERGVSRLHRPVQLLPDRATTSRTASASRRPRRNGAIHDDTQQGQASATSSTCSTPPARSARSSATSSATSRSRTAQDVAPSFTVNGISQFDSAKSDETQLEQNHFLVLSYLKTAGDLSLQVSVFARYSSCLPSRRARPTCSSTASPRRWTAAASRPGCRSTARYTATPTHTLTGGSTSRPSARACSRPRRCCPRSRRADLRPAVSRSSTAGARPATPTASTFKMRGGSCPPSPSTAGCGSTGSSAFTSEWQLSPRLNVVWEATPTTTIHAGYARYFTPPRQEFVATGASAGSPTPPRRPSVPINAPVRAERAHYIDAGVTQQIIPGLKVGLDAYYKRSLYHLDEGQFGAPTFLTPFNYHHATNIGIELSDVLHRRRLLRLRQPGRRPAGGQGHRLRAGPVRRGGPRLHPRALHRHRSQPAHHRLGRARLPLARDRG